MQLIFVLKYVQIAGQSFVTFIYFFYFSSNAFSESTMITYVFGIFYQLSQNVGSTDLWTFFYEI